MANNDDLLKQIRNIVSEEVKSETNPLKIDLQAVKQAQAQTGGTVAQLVQTQAKISGTVTRLEQGQASLQQSLAQTNTSLGQIKTLVEAVAAGQKDIQENMATKADMQDLQAKVVKRLNKHDERLEIIENELKLPHPHKH